MAGQPGSFQPRGEDWMVRELQALRGELNQLRAANVFGLTGIKPKDGGTDLDGFVNINGPLEVNGDSAINGPLNVNGAMAVTGTLSLPAGIIDNAALAAPVSPLATHVGTNNFGLSTGPNVPILTTSITVPAGYTQALVFAAANMHAYNNNAAQDDAYAVVFINGTSVGASSQTTAAATSSVCLNATGTLLITGLGASFTVVVKGSSAGSAWAVATNNFINLDVMTIFLR
jgi:hypothetical protein